MSTLINKNDRKDIDLLEYWRIIVKRKWVLAAFCAILLVGAAVKSFTTTPLYRATASILIDEPGTSMINIQDILNSGGYYRSDYLGTYFNTQLRLLTSRSLAERVAKRLNLAARPELRGGGGDRPGLTQRLRNILTGKGRPDAADIGTGAGGASQAASFYYVVLGGLQIHPVEETRLVMVSYVSPSSTLAADIVNAVAEEFVTFSIETRYEATRQTSEFLDEQTASLREELKRKEEELQKYGQEKKLLYLNDKESTVVNKFAEVNSAFTEAQIDRFKKEAVYRELKSLNVDTLPQSVSNETIQALKATYTQVKSEYEEKSSFYRPDYPEMIKLKARLDSTRNALREEISKAVGTAEAEYRASQKKESSLLSLLESERGDVVKMNNNSILYRSLQIEVDNMRNLLSTLVSRQNEIQVTSQLGGLRTSNIKVIDKALVPGGPFTPNTKRNLIMALLLGLVGGIGLVFFIEYVDNTVKGPDEVEKLTGLPTLGIIPYLSNDSHKKQDRYGTYGTYGAEPEANSEADSGLTEIREIELVNYLFPKYAIAEDYRTLRTSILFSHADSAPKTICFTSTMPQEGKTATVANLAVSFAQLEGKVLLVDADLRKPRLHKIFDLKNHVGLSDYLTGKLSFDEAIQKSAINNIWIISSGPHPPNPAELLNSKRMRDLLATAKERFDVILVDTPPVLAVIDPVIVSALTDSTIMVIRAGKTTRRALVRAFEELRKAKSDIIGAVFNEVKIGPQNIGVPYYHYYQYEYSSGNSDKRRSRQDAARYERFRANGEGPKDPGGPSGDKLGEKG